jgi:tetratricopeptide (TPR) repeat protein/2-polyprenyl-3-methyl-5-hydroxy-6-metoxy-1,4-benzoquinol methylase
MNRTELWRQEKLSKKNQPRLNGKNCIAEAQEALQRGIMSHRSGRIDEAIQWYRKSLEVNPENTTALSNMGFALQTKGNLDEAIACLQKAISIKPDFVEAHSNLGNALKDQGELDEAVISFQKAISIKPDFAEAHSNLGNSLQDQGKLDEAVASYQKAISIKPDYLDAYHNLAHLLLLQGKIVLAFKCYKKAITIDPNSSQFWFGYAKCLEKLSFTQYDHELTKELLLMIEQHTIVPKRVAKAIMTNLHHHPDILLIGKQIRLNTLKKDIGNSTKQLSNIPLLLKLMKLTTINDAELEQILTTIRLTLLQKIFDKTNDSTIQPFHTALAIHCFINEYVFFVTTNENQQIEKLKQQISYYLCDDKEIPPLWIAVLGCYMPLNKASFADKLLEYNWPDKILEVVSRHIKEPKLEQELRPQIHCVVPVTNSISKKVQRQYEENPYPVWIQPNVHGKAITIKQLFQNVLINQDKFLEYTINKPEILIAGCGTGQQSIQTASRFKNSHLTAVDLSLSSLSYAIRKSIELQVTNIDYLQCDIYDLKKLEMKFDIIECRGVLHHLADPVAGWKILVDLLHKNGLMKIGLYSSIARRGIRKTRNLIKEMGYTPTPDDIRKCRQYILSMTPDADPEIYNNIYSRDFYSMSECRDLIFHTQESQFTLLEINTALKDLGLQFLGFEHIDSSVTDIFKTLNPEKESMVSLPKWHIFEENNPNTFAGLYEFWVQKI